MAQYTSHWPDRKGPAHDPKPAALWLGKTPTEQKRQRLLDDALLERLWTISLDLKTLGLRIRDQSTQLEFVDGGRLSDRYVKTGKPPLKSLMERYQRRFQMAAKEQNQV